LIRILTANIKDKFVQIENRILKRALTANINILAQIKNEGFDSPVIAKMVSEKYALII
jgi:hypothetical protein